METLMINTTKGMMDSALLEKKEGVLDNENEHTTWVEYWDKKDLVHRSVHVTLKKNVWAEGIATMLA